MAHIQLSSVDTQLPKWKEASTSTMKRQEEANKKTFPPNKDENTKAAADSPSSSSIIINPILKSPGTQPPGISVSPHQQANLTSQIDEVVNLCKTFSKNMDILNNNQSEIKMRIHSQEEKAENNIKRLEIGIKQTLDQNNDMIGDSINILNQQAQDTQSQMMRLQQDLQQIQHRQFSPERNPLRPKSIDFNLKMTVEIQQMTKIKTKK